MTELIRLKNRSVIEVSGPDAHDFLQGILTNDIEGVHGGKAIYAGLLTPQGKLLFDFIIVKKDETFFFDVDGEQLADLVKRLMFYKLRADVEIAILGQAAICVRIDGKISAMENAVGYADPRFNKLASRTILFEPTSNECLNDAEKWLEHRIELGLPEAEADFTYGSCFPHDIAMDQLNGIGFSKGCYVGQEVVSRMQHRGTARKRPMIIQASEKLPTEPANIEAEGALMGPLGSILGKNGLAQIRLDRAAKALENGKTFNVGNIKVQVITPPWAQYGEQFKTNAE